MTNGGHDAVEYAYRCRVRRDSAVRFEPKRQSTVHMVMYFDGRGHRYNTNPGRYDILILEAVVSCDNYASSSRGHVQVGVQFAARFGQVVVLLAKVCAS